MGATPEWRLSGEKTTLAGGYVSLYGLMGVSYIFENKQLEMSKFPRSFCHSCLFSRVGTMGRSKASRAAEERLKNQLRCTNSGQFTVKDDEEKKTDTDQIYLDNVMVEELTETLVAARQHEQDALTAARNAVDAMQMMTGIEQNDDEVLLCDDEGNEISVSEYFNRELELRDVDPEEDDPEDGPEVFVINEEEESGVEIIPTESWRFLKDANSTWQPRKIMQRGSSIRTEQRRRHDAMLLRKSATAPGQKSILGFLRKEYDDYDTEDEMNDGGKIVEGQDEEEIVGDKYTMQQAIEHLSGFEAKITRNANENKKDTSMMWQKVQAMALEFAVRKYRTHRAISSEQKTNIKTEFETYMQNKKRK